MNDQKVFINKIEDTNLRDILLKCIDIDINERPTTPHILEVLK